MGVFMKKSYVFLFTIFVASLSLQLNAAKRPVEDKPEGLPDTKRARSGAAAVASDQGCVVGLNKGLINTGTDCFLNSALQILFLPQVRAFLDQNRGDYLDHNQAGEYSIPGKLIKFLDQMQASTTALCSNDFRTFVCQNSSNSDLRGMVRGHQDSCEFLKHMLGYLQNYTVYHFNMLQMFQPSFCDENNKIFFKDKIIRPVLEKISDFACCDEISVEVFLALVSAQINETKLNIYIARLKNEINAQGFDRTKEARINSLSVNINQLLENLNKKDSMQAVGLFCFLQNLLGSQRILEITCGCIGSKRTNFEDVILMDGELDIIGEWALSNLTGCQNKMCDTPEKVKKFVCDKLAYLRLNERDNQFLQLNIEQFDLIQQFIGQTIQGLALSVYLANIKRVVTDLRNFFGIRRADDGTWSLMFDIFRSRNHFEINITHNETCLVSDLLNDEMIARASLPEILIAIAHPFVPDTYPITLKYYEEVKRDGQAVRLYEPGDDEIMDLSENLRYKFTLKPLLNITIHQQNYKLIGMIYHRGYTPIAGHYIASGLYDKKWEIFDDKVVRLFDNNFIKNFSPQVMVYQRVDASAACVPSSSSVTTLGSAPAAASSVQ